MQRLERSGLVGTRIALLKSEAAMEPGVFGIKRPVLVWPSEISDRLDDAHLEAILAHEVCHVRRQDNLAALMHMLVEAIFWFYPLVWWLGSQLVAEREHACDEQVLESGSERQVYAESILKICEFCVGSPLTCVAGVTGADLKRRIARIMSEQMVRRLGFGRKLLLSTGLLAALAIPVVFGFMHAPQIRAAAAAQEAVSNGAATPWQLTSFGPSTVVPEKTGGLKKVGIKFGPDGLSGMNISAHMLIEDAYGVHDNQIEAEPSWASTDGWDFEAKGPVAMPSGGKPILGNNEARTAMMQTLLADKFKLAVHRETRQLPVYQLVLDPNGSKLTETKAGDLVPESFAIKDPAGHPMPSAFKSSPGEMLAHAVATSDLAGALSQRLATNVLDNTGLQGRYDFRMTWTPDRSGLPANAPEWTETAGPSLMEALRGQLGLQLKADTTPMEVIVIDHIEKPTN